MNLKTFVHGDLFFWLRIASRGFIAAMGLFLLIDDMIWHNIGGFRDAGLNPIIAVNENIMWFGIHIHHGWIGFILLAMASFSIYLLFMEKWGKLD